MQFVALNSNNLVNVDNPMKRIEQRKFLHFYVIAFFHESVGGQKLQDVLNEFFDATRL